MADASPSLVPLFGALPGGAELILALVAFVVPIGLALYVGLDAREQTDHPLAWGLATLVAGFSPFFIGAIAVTVLYRLSRDELGSVAPPTFGEADMDDDAQVLGQSLGSQRAAAEKSGDADGFEPAEVVDDDDATRDDER